MKRHYTYRLRRNDWRRADIALLRRYASTHTAAQIATMLGRSGQAVYCKACKLGIPLLKDGDHDVRRKYSDDVAREAMRRYLHGTESMDQIAAAMGIPRSCIQKWIRGLERPHLLREFARS